MKKNGFIKSAFILMIGGIITKTLGMFIRILISRYLGVKGIGLYSLVNPTFMLFICICQLGLPTAISKIVAEEKRRSKNLILGLIPFIIILNILLMIILFIISPFLATNLLHEKDVLYALFSISFVLPFISISSILRGYFFGKEKMFIHVFSNILEDLVRMVLIILFLPKLVSYNLKLAISFLILSNIASELTSILFFSIFLPKEKLKKEDFILNKKTHSEVFKIGIPLTISRLIGNLGAFLEPIILTTVLIKVGYKSDFIISEYGIISGYVLPILLLPSFFTTAISQAMIPSISKCYSNKKYIQLKRKVKQGILLSLSVGIPITLFYIIKPKLFLNFLYHTNKGSHYLKVLSPIFLLQYIQSPIIFSMQAIGKSKIALIGTILGTSIKIISLILFSFLKIGIWPLIISISLSIILTSLYDIKALSKCLKYKS